ncbi:uncharacterized protein LOC108319697 [Vigna angularis]|uniref:uncharacterized protein LOC108319697 n=1 Tax=Phaseolus angularis TaxID=3914 RepID=UPI000809A81F|nr:uncharacterized protein LOC108319697 [Vigna angularis]
MAYDLGFVVVIVRFDIAIGVQGRKTFVILGCERGGKYRKYKADAVASVYDTRKYECPFRLKGKPCSDGAGWVLKVMCGHHNHELAETLVGHPYEYEYRLSLLEIVGMTSTGLTFSTTFAFLSTKRQSNFTWALEKLKGLFLTSEGGPKVIVTDRDLALMNVIANENVMDCDDESLFVEYVNGFQYTSSSWPLFFEYVNQTWIILYNTYFVKFWTNKVMHLVNTTTNRAESAHWSLKKVLGNSMGDLCSCWDNIHNVIILQHNKIKASFESSLLLTSDHFKGYRYRELIRRVSRYALDLIAKELKIVQQIGLDSSKCGCILRRTFGVPCTCELARYDPKMIPIVETSRRTINEVDIGGKVTIKQKLLEIVCPTLTSMVPQLHKVKTKDAQKSKVQRSERSTTRDPSYFEYVDAFHSTIESSYVRSKLQSKPKAVKKRRVPMIDQFHSTTHPFIVDVVDVVADGHCGYRCIVALLGLGEDSWPVIRNEL